MKIGTIKEVLSLIALIIIIRAIYITGMYDIFNGSVVLLILGLVQILFCFIAIVSYVLLVFFGLFHSSKS